MLFNALVFVVIVQRVAELIVARKNHKWALQRGGIELGARHYKYIVWLHVAFFISLVIEHTLKPSLNSGWFFFFLIFLVAQMIRLWSLLSLGRHWNTRIIVIPNSERVKKGPYRFLKHPNYVVVSIELFTLPLMFAAYVTAITFSLLNFLFLFFVRIPVENAALDRFVSLENNPSSP